MPQQLPIAPAGSVAAPTELAGARNSDDLVKIGADSLQIIMEALPVDGCGGNHVSWLQGASGKVSVEPSQQRAKGRPVL
ncbi:hypothetical protein GCM10009740_14330 [Terrabacter terrae]|uniref:Uncharacterized protein n=1 Tax=Terrabacter terrae TaxID=318434 RepID=A0ABP5FIC4_9MICO